MFFLTAFILIIALTSGKPIVTGRQAVIVPNFDWQSARQIVYKRFQLSSELNLRVISNVFTRIPGLSLTVSHSRPMLYEVQFEAICRIDGQGNAFQIGFLYDDYIVDQDHLVKNDGSRWTVMPDFWLNPGFGGHHFPCTRTETMSLKSGIHTIEVGIRAQFYAPHVDILVGRLTVKLSEYNWDPILRGSLKILDIPDSFK